MSLADTLLRTHGEVARTDELMRVYELPRKAKLPSIAAELTKWLGGRGSMVLYDVQADALAALHDYGGAFCIIPVGGGKTLIAYLAPRVVDARSAVLVIPASLVEKTRTEFAELEAAWGPTNLRIVTFEDLSTGRGSLDGADLLVVDECHGFKRPYSARTRVFLEFMSNNDIPCVCMSGTITDRSLMDFWHIIGACLGTANMPLPARLAEVQKWANAVDEKTDVRARPGALTLFTGGSQRLEDVRAAVGRRIIETPGVVYMESTDVGASIRIETRTIKPAAEVQGILRQIVREKLGPNGEELTPADVWRHSRTALWGFTYEWDPPAPEKWLKARSRWKRLVRCVLESYDPNYKTELSVANAAKRGELDDATCRAWAQWQAIRKSFTPHKVPRWYTKKPIEMLAKLDTDLVWVEYEAIGEALEEITGWPYYRQKGMCGKRFVGDHRSGPAILSIGACHKGLNLQRFHRNVIVNVPPKGETWEQLIGRTHRPKQQHDPVEFVVFARAHDVDLIQAREDALYQQQTTRQPKKLCLADWI